MSGNTKQKNLNQGYTVYLGKVAVMIALMFGVGFLPVFGQMTELGMKVLGVFIGLLFGWSCIGVVLPCFVGFIALSLSGIATPSALTTGCFGSEVVILLVAMYAIIDVMNQSGVNDFLVNWLLSRKILQGRPWLFSFIIILACYVSGVIIGGFAAMLLIWSIIYKIAEITGMKAFDPYPTCLIIGTTLAGAMSAVVFPFLGTALFLCSAFSAMSGFSIDYAQFMGFVVPGALFTFAAYILVMRFIFRIDVSAIKNADINTLVNEDKLHTNLRQKLVLVLFVILMVMMLLPSILPAESLLCVVLNSISNTGKVLLLYAVMSVIRIEGKPLIDVGKALKNSVAWEMVIMVGFISQLATFISSDACGIKGSLAEAISPLALGHGTVFFTIMVLFLCMAVTNFMNNGPVAIIMMSVAVSMSGTVGANLMAICAGCILFSQLAYATPIASPFSAMLFSNKDWIRPKDVYLYGGISTCILIPLCILFTVLWGSVIF